VGKKRYVNQVMEEELAKFIDQIEEKFKKSSMKTYVFKRRLKSSGGQSLLGPSTPITS
jgi:predicted SprT family Zn-dependent metalloprotease